MKNFNMQELLEYGDWCRTGLTSLEYTSLSNSGILYSEWRRAKKKAEFEENLRQDKLWSNVKPGDVLVVVSKDSRSKIELGEEVIVRKIWYSTRAFEDHRANVYDIRLQRTRKSSIKHIKISSWSNGVLVNSNWLFEKSNSKSRIMNWHI